MTFRMTPAPAELATAELATAEGALTVHEDPPRPKPGTLIPLVNADGTPIGRGVVMADGTIRVTGRIGP